MNILIEFFEFCLSIVSSRMSQMIFLKRDDSHLTTTSWPPRLEGERRGRKNFCAPISTRLGTRTWHAKAAAVARAAAAAVARAAVAAAAVAVVSVSDKVRIAMPTTTGIWMRK